jgi:hypothetical protein
LHGHIHKRFHVALAGFATRLFGAGSATCDGRESFWMFDVDASQRRATPGHFERDHYVLDESAALSF